jgi:spore coat protein A, manganese oxidase
MKKEKWQLKMTRRQVLKAGMIGGAGLMLPLRFLPAKAWAVNPGDACSILGCSTTLHSPAWQFDNGAAFTVSVPDALADGFKYTPVNQRGNNVFYKVGAGKAMHDAGLVNLGGTALGTSTVIYGYGQIPEDGLGYTWPGRTFEVQKNKRTVVQWSNNLPIEDHLLPVDTNLHWAYSLHGYTDYTIPENGTPIVMHLHGGHNKDLYDGNPEQFFSPGGPAVMVKGPRYYNNFYVYDNDRHAGNLWYHDHALGITRLNVYAGMAGFYFLRDEIDTGKNDNPLGLPAGDYEKAYAIQCRMFNEDGTLFYPAFLGDPFYDGFITGEGATLPPGDFPINGGPTALAEFFGDHMIVNGIAWPKENVEPRIYRLHILNGTDSRFMAIQFRTAAANGIEGTGSEIPFTVIGSDQGLAESATPGVTRLLSEPGSRYDILFDFRDMQNTRIIMENKGGDEPFGGSFTTDDPALQIFEYTDRIMAFDVASGANGTPFDDSVINLQSDVPAPDRIRNVALFEGKDEFGRLQPLLGTAEPAFAFNGQPIYWPDTPVYQNAKLPDGTLSPLTGLMEGSIAWHSPTTENPAQKSTEEWHVWNVTGDAHPIHLHLVHFKIIGRRNIKWDTATDGREDRVLGRVNDPEPNNDGTYLVQQPTVQHNSVAGDASTYGSGFKIINPTVTNEGLVDPPENANAYVENAPKDMVTALPDQVTIFRARFDKPGRYVWHCHILSHEDHEMMRVLHVGGGDKDPYNGDQNPG